MRYLSTRPGFCQSKGDRLSFRLSSLLSFLLVANLTTCQVQAPPVLQADESIHLLLGNPSDAVPNPDTPDNYLIVRPQYAMSYSRDRATANWVAWQLNESWLGQRDRPPFTPDPFLPTGWYQVDTNDYTGSGFNRGHLVPAADRNRRQADSESVFYMTNIMPQAPDNNQGPWVDLEIYSRDLAELGNELYIIAGTAGVGGEGEQGRRDTIGQGRITVPEFVWKIVVVVDRPIQSLDEVTDRDRVIAVLMPNIQGIRQQDWREFRRSVDQIEQITGYDFMADLPGELENALEVRVDDL
ncbi:MAG: DNA/RNA non-specific endonuclease [Cyanobacteria bacterium J06638_20]